MNKNEAPIDRVILRFGRPAGFLALGIGFGLTSCSLPPREAWNRVQDKGLIPTLMASNASAAETGADDVSDFAESPSEPIAQNAWGGMVQTEPEERPDVGSDAEPDSDVPSQPRSRRPFRFGSLFAAGTPTAKPIGGTAAHVYSPFTGEDKAVDVSGLASGSRAKCPYTGKVFIVPDLSEAVSETSVEHVAESTLIEEPKVKPSAPPKRIRVGREKKKSLAKSKPRPKPKRTVASTDFVPSLPEPSLPAKPPVEEKAVLVGTVVPGRPGFVRSPFAKESQLVDVTGLEPGQEVRCPYSGKLFKVPAGANKAIALSNDKPSLPTQKPKPSVESDGPNLIDRPEVAKVDDESGTKDEESKEEPEKTKLPSDATGLARPLPKKPNDSGSKPEPAKSEPKSESKPVDAEQSKEPKPKNVEGGESSLPVAKRVAGRQGLVHSPYAAKSQLVDVSGKAPGSKVRCPFSGKAFLVPE